MVALCTKMRENCTYHEGILPTISHVTGRET